MISSRAPLDVGSTIADRYELVRLIARGGMAEVFEALDLQLRRRVALKLFRAAASGDRARFDAEVLVLAGLSHPGLVHVYDAGEEGADAFLVLELVEGPTLRTLLADRGPLPSEEVAGIGAAVAGALTYIHERGVVHRDVTPSNVLCGEDGRPRLADFGIARLVDTTRLTATSTAIGTAGYMAPEQVQGRDVTPAADVYALGLVLLELLTGQPAFTGTAQEVAVARLVRSPDLDAAPRAWRTLLAQMTDRAPSNRPSAIEVGAALRSLGQAGATATAAIAVPLAAELPTAAMDAAPGTMVMPAVLAPDLGTPLADEPPRGPRPRTRALVVTAAGALLVAVLVVAASSGGIDLPASSTTTTTVTSEPVVAEAPPTTAAPVITEAPKADPPGKGNGKGGKDDDD